MFLRKPQQIIIFVVIALAIVFGLMYLGVIPGLRQRELEPVTLNFWGVDDASSFTEAISDYQQLNPHVRIRYRRLNEDSYEDEILNALAANEPMDIIMFKNSWLPKHFDKIIPLTDSSFFSQFQNLFPTVAIQDFAPEGVVYGSPLYIDTLAMFYNRDIFDSKAIASPPRNWSELLTVVQKLSNNNSKKQSLIPVAMGGGNRNIANATDLLNLLFIQSGAPMVDENFTRAEFAVDGENVLSFYSQFKYPANKYSFDSFAAGETGIVFGYQNQIKEILDRNPFLPLKVAPIPRPTASVQNTSWARYYGLSVARNSRTPQEAWKFILYLTASPSAADKYLSRSKRPPALRSLINKKLDDIDLGIFAKQALSARSYPQIDDNLIRDIFSQMIESVVSGQFSPFSAITRAESEINRLIQIRRR